MEKENEIIAQRIVKDALNLGSKDSLGIFAYEHMLPLAKEIVKSARKLGADTLLFTDSDDVWHEALSKLPMEWLKEASVLNQAVRNATTAMVYMEGPENPEILKSISTERWRANSEGASATFKPFEDKPIPSVSIELSRVTKARAMTYGFDYDAWYRSTMNAMAVDPKLMREKGERLKGALKGAKKGRLSAPGGTDFEFEFEGVEAAIYTGEIRPVHAIKATYFGSLPSGALSIALKQGSGHGRVVSTMPIPQVGEFIKGLTWVFEKGRITKAEAAENFKHFQIFWDDDKKKKGADQLGTLSIGLNPNSSYGFLTSDLVEGCVTLLIGDNTYLGGTNDSDYGFPISFKDATLEVDGKKLVEDGKIVN